MTPERWQMVRGILQSAMELRPAERNAFLDRECASDPSLRKDVDEMLSAQGKLDPGFLESPAAAQVEFPAGSFASASILAAGTRLGNYEVRALLGAGGMGQVYRARDLQLKREVAIKIIPNLYSSDPARRHRFKQEAEATAALNHPNILTVHQVGEHEGTFYIVAELLQGETLRERLKTGSLQLRTATDYSAQIARGLAAAHENGIIHRDLKPENIFVTKDGRIKILDFGLAKLVEQRADLRADDERTKSTETQWTEPGLVLGTTAYMSPEQVKGGRIDHRSDIFAFGAVLYEMLSGRLAFAKGTSAETMAAILNEDPPALSQTGQNIPPGMQRVIQRSLEKRPEQRFQSASDLAFALEALSESGSGPVAAFPRRSRPRWLWIAAGLAVVVAAVVAAWWFIPSRVPVVESVTQITNDGEPKLGAAATDGSRIYFDEGNEFASHLAQVSISGGRTAPVENAPKNYSLISLLRDGSEVLLQESDVYLREGDYWSLPLPAGEPRRILDGESVTDPGLLPDGRIVYISQKQSGNSDLMIAEKDGTRPQPIRSFSSSVGGVSVSPDGERILFFERNPTGGVLQSVGKDGSDLSLIRNWTMTDQDVVTSYCWSHDQKYVVYSRKVDAQSDLWAVPTKTDFFHRSPAPVRLTAGPLSYSGAFASPDGRILTIGTKSRTELVRYDPKLRQFVPFFPGLSAVEVDFSADGKWMTYISFPDLTLWLSRIDGSERKQLTFPPLKVTFPRFSPDGTKIAFSSQGYGSYVVDTSGGEPRKIAERSIAEDSYEPNWSPDGKNLVSGVLTVEKGFQRYRLRIINVSTAEISDVPSSEELLGAWYINANTLVANDFASKKFVTFDLTHQKRSDLVAVIATAWEESPDRKYLYYIAAVSGKELQLLRVRFSDGKVEFVTSLKDLRQMNNPTHRGNNFTVAPDGSVIFPRDISAQEIYALNVRWP